MPRRTRWTDAFITLSVASGSQVITPLLESMTGDDVQGITITRTILDLSLAASTIAGAFGFQTIDLGLALISEEAHVAGVVPEPGVPGDRPVGGWLWRRRLAVSQNGIGGQVIHSVSVDLRAQRKVTQGVYDLIINNTANTGTSFGLSVIGSVRTLVRLP